MASSLFGSSSQTQSSAGANNPAQMMQQLQQFAGALRGRGDPQQLVMSYMRQNGIGQDQLQQVMQQAKSIGQMLGLR